MVCMYLFIFYLPYLLSQSHRGYQTRDARNLHHQSSDQLLVIKRAARRLIY